DLLGALGVVLGLRQHTHKYFCSEWCFEAITNKQDGWRFSPNDLYAIKSILTRRH
ncbi:enoyl-CoA hydratase, partial [Moraxella catarrhalis]|nr:enoyl-CoA hydratase [Moraxella catarrhalis]